MSFSFTDRTGDGVTTAFTFSFTGPDAGYIRESDIVVLVDGVDTTFTLTGLNSVDLDTTPADQALVRIMRVMPLGAPYTDFSRGNPFGKRNINNSFLQQLYSLHSLADGFREDDYYEKQDLNLGGNQIINLRPPENPEDVADKAYVDARFLTEGSLPSPIAGEEGYHLEASAPGVFAWTEQATLGDLAPLDTVDTLQIEDGAVTADKLSANAVTTSKILNDAVTSLKILDAAVTAGKIDPAVVLGLDMLSLASTWDKGQSLSSYLIPSATGTITPLISNGNMQHFTATDSFTLAEPTDTDQGWIEIEITNDGTGGYSPDYTTNFNLISGEYDATASAVNLFRITKHNTNTYLEITQGVS